MDENKKLKYYISKKINVEFFMTYYSELNCIKCATQKLNWKSDFKDIIQLYFPVVEKYEITNSKFIESKLQGNYTVIKYAFICPKTKKMIRL